MKIAIASGKGGTGKTTVSTNLSALIAEKEAMHLVDLDVEEPNSAIFIHTKKYKEEIQYKHVPEWNSDACTLCGICQDACNFHAILQLGKEMIIFPELCHSCHACTELCPNDALSMKDARIGLVNYYKEKDFEFLEGKLDIGQEQAVPLINLTKIAEENLPSEAGITIYDAPPGTSCPVIEATKDADLVLLVTEPTPFGLHDLKLAVETMQKLNKDFAVIINRDGIGNNDVQDYCKQEKIEVIANIPFIKKAAEAYARGELMIHQVEEIKNAFEDIYRFIEQKKKDL